MVSPANQVQHNAEIAKLRDEVAQAKEDLVAENARMTAERAVLDAQEQQIQANSFRLSLDLNASNEIMRRRHRSRQPLVYEARNLFCTPGAGTSDQLEINRVEAPGAGAPAQPRTTEPPCLNKTLPQYVPTSPGHYSNPLDNMIAAATRLVALPFEGILR